MLFLNNSKTKHKTL